jgi:hypothetical protein
MVSGFKSRGEEEDEGSAFMSSFLWRLPESGIVA